jgi:methyl acetate hydrolase
MIMQGGSLKDAQILRPETAALMAQNHIGALEVGVFKTAIPPALERRRAVPRNVEEVGAELPDQYAAGAQRPVGGRPGLGGLANTYFWIDRTKHVAGVFLSQVLPFYDHTAIDLFGKFETEVYRAT